MLTPWRFQIAVVASGLIMLGSMLPSTVLAQDTRRLCAELFTRTTLSSDLPPSVLLRNLAILDFLQEGGEAEAYKVRYRERLGVFRYLHTRNPKQTNYTKLDRTQTHQLVAMTESEARQVFPQLQLRQDSFEKPLSEFEEAQLDQARALLLAIDSIRLQHLRYHDQNLVPPALALVRHSNGLILGQIIEFVPGSTLKDMIARRLLNASQLETVIDQVKEQAQLLATHGFLHGDLVPSNMIVNLENGRVQARLIDFNLQQKSDPELSKLLQADLDGLERLRKLHTGRARAF